MASVAAAERAALCDLFVQTGPDAPTLCGDWTTRDLAAHLVVRERRPDAGPGLLTHFLAGFSEKVRVAEAERPWGEIVERVRNGPPLWNPMHFEPVDTFINSVEFFVHHEDVRRAQPGWTVRELSPALQDALAAALDRGGRLLVRKLRDTGLVLDPDDRPPITVRRATPAVTIRGPLAECVLYVYGRKDVAGVSLEGPDDAVAAVRASPFGL
jgi:uncharacterized protein (TIGR03085 family)